MENNFKFYNTLTKKIETVIPHEDGKIAMYTCGPTVYHFAHIGNLRSYLSLIHISVSLFALPKFLLFPFIALLFIYPEHFLFLI